MYNTKTKQTNIEKVMRALPNPCNTCPYRKDTPSGIWDKSEYDKLPQWDNQYCMAGTFLCHNGNREYICRGWAEVHHRNMSVRLACFNVEWDETNSKPTKIKLYRTGAEARRAGLRKINNPDDKAKAVIVKLVGRGKSF